MIQIPCAPDGTPLVDIRVVGDVLARHPDLRMGFDEFLALDEDFHGDWIDGQVRLLGGETLDHQEAVGTLSCLLNLCADAKDLGDVVMRIHMRPRPDLPTREVDLLFLRHERRGLRRDKFVDGPADLVVEVVSDESRELDLAGKLAEYEAGGVREYWVVDPPLRRAQVFRLNDAGRYEPLALGEPAVIRSEVLAGLELPVEWIWDDRHPPFRTLAREWGIA